MSAAPEMVIAPEPLVAWPLIASLQALAAELTGSLLAIQQLARAVADAGMSGLGAQTSLVAVLSSDGSHFRAVHAAGLSRLASSKVDAVAADGGAFVARVARSRDPVFLPSVAAATTGPDSPRTLASGAVVGLPIRRDGRGFGVIVLGWPESRAFSDGDRGFLAALRGICTLALDRLLLSVERDRLRDLLSRARVLEHPAMTHLDVGDMHIDLVGHRVVIAGRTVVLTPTELALLVCLAEAPGRARTRREILAYLWHSEHVGDERVCDAHVSNLRHKIEHDPARPERVVTKRGIGYALQVH